MKKAKPGEAAGKLLERQVSKHHLASDERQILITLALLPHATPRWVLELLTDFARSTCDRYIQSLNAKGFVKVNGDVMRLTVAGMAAVEGLPSTLNSSGADSGDYLPVLLPAGGKRALARIAWPHRDPSQAKFIKAGLSNSNHLSREEYIQLVSSERARMNDGLIDELLAIWAIQAYERKPELAKHDKRFLQWWFTQELVEFLLGPEVLRLPPDPMPQDIVRCYLLSEIWKLTVQLVGLERHRRRGGEATKRNAKIKHARVLELFKKMREAKPGLTNRSAAARLIEMELEKAGDKSPLKRKTIMNILPKAEP